MKYDKTEANSPHLCRYPFSSGPGVLLWSRSPAKYPRYTHSILVESWSEDDRDWTDVRQDGKAIGTVEGYDASSNICYSMDHSEATFTTLCNRTGAHSRPLYLAADGRLTLIEGDAEAQRMALSGGAVTYLRQTDRGNAFELCLYGKGKTEVIAGDIHDRYLGFTLSPHGRTVLYGADDGLHWYDGRTDYFLGWGLRGVAVSDKGLIYLRDAGDFNDARLYVQQGGDNESRVDLGDGHFRCFTRDLRQVLYSAGTRLHGGGVSWQTYLLLDGKEKIPVENLSIPLLPRGT